MRRLGLILIAVFFVCALAACGDSGSPSVSSTQSDVPQSSGGLGSLVTDNPGPSQKTEDAMVIDIDLTKLSKTVAVAETRNFLESPMDYMGKVIKAEGQYAILDENGATYYFILMQDMEACCFLPIEIIIANGKYPRQEGESLTVVGTVNSYTEGQQVFYYLDVADI